MCQLDKVAQGSPRMAPARGYNEFSSKPNHMTTGSYLVACPALGEREIVFSQEQACDVCYSMHEESGAYAFVEDWLGWTVMEYGDAA